ncbi:SRPBCC family protein [Mycolicibacterium flavescens]|uniref:Polyketide cyclase n=1 Tax=Mycolicibacterium flavescens TaxID=1776 RepID=A0A1E3RRE1_MYCFV|nr:polyketide cyclase [Mycolicibacterium flavescens]MCV7279438.1 SRPBCC family protein [Mycolicibacterium flavescens]ODQ91957.1 polyketide cyclase [Mycolicibacterium flavescens]
MESRHVSVWINADPDTVYRFAADLRTWPSWAAGLAEGGLRQTADGWVADSPMGQVRVEPTPENEFGVLDHVVQLPSGEKVYNPMRVQPGDTADAACEVVFSVRRRAGMSDADFDADAAAVADDLATLRGLIER